MPSCSLRATSRSHNPRRARRACARLRVARSLSCSSLRASACTVCGRWAEGCRRRGLCVLGMLSVSSLSFGRARDRQRQGMTKDPECVRRCTECRRRFAPEPSALATQKLCGDKACKASRRNALARARRLRDVQDYRVDERVRQRASRAQRAAASKSPAAPQSPPRAGPAVTECHVPPSTQNAQQITLQLLAEWDKAAAESRASLKRRVTAILARSASFAGQEGDVAAPVSRAGLGPQTPETTPDS